MYEELMKRLRTICPEGYDNPMDFAYGAQQAMCEAADAIEELIKGGTVMDEQEVKLVMDENGRLYVVTEDGKRFILVPYDRNGVFAE